MRVRCIRELPTSEQAEKLYPFYRPDTGQVFAVEVGTEYTVFSIDTGLPIPLLGIADDNGLLYPTPSCLFEIVDASLPALWVAHMNADGDLSLEPPSFNDFYFSDLADGEPAVVSDFRRVRDMLEPSTAAPDA
jgi:hypothetical protein